MFTTKMYVYMFFAMQRSFNFGSEKNLNITSNDNTKSMC